MIFPAVFDLCKVMAMKNQFFSITTRRPESPGRESVIFKVKISTAVMGEGRGRKKEMKKKKLSAVEALLNCFNVQNRKKKYKRHQNNISPLLS